MVTAPWSEIALLGLACFTLGFCLAYLITSKD